MHSKLITQYDYQEVCVPSHSQVNEWTGDRLSSQDGVSQQQETAPLLLPHLNLLFEVSFVWDESSVSNTDVASSPHSIGSSNRYSSTGRPSGISNVCSWVHVALNS